MTSEKLYGILQFLDRLDTDLQIQRNLEEVSTNLSDLADSPAVTQYQTQLADAVKALETAAPKLQAGVLPSQVETIKAMGGDDFFDVAMIDKVKEAVQKNAMTIAVARDQVKELVTNRAAFLKTVRSAKQSLEKLNVRDVVLKAGSADLAFLIPREIFKNELGAFANELKFINRLIVHLNEAILGAAQPAQLEQLSSSVPTIALIAALPVLSMLGDIVNKFLEAWEKIERIRKVRSELTELAIPGPALEHIDEQITTTVDKVVEESTQMVLAKYPLQDNGRKAELKNGIKSEIFTLFGQIERGLSIEIHVNTEDKPDQNEADKEALNVLSVLSKTLTFPEPAKQPMLLKSGEVIAPDNEDVIVISHSKKTTTKKTVSKKTKEEAPQTSS
jgi:hypothetical protein